MMGVGIHDLIPHPKKNILKYVQSNEGKKHFFNNINNYGNYSLGPNVMSFKNLDIFILKFKPFSFM